MMDGFFFILIGIAILAWLGISYSNRKKNEVPSIPGLKPSDSKDGNNGDMANAGSLHQFLSQLHRKYGSIASFWIGEQFTVSIASAKLFKEQSKFFNRPVLLFKLFEPLITPNSIQYANGEDGRKRREIYDPMYSHQSVTQLHLPVLQQIADKMMDELAEIPYGQHVPIEKYMFQFSLRSICETTFGRKLPNDTHVDQLKEWYDVVWNYMEGKLSHLPSDAAADERFVEARADFYAFIQSVIDEKKKSSDGTLLIDVLLRSKLKDEVVSADALTFLIGGSHTTGLMLTWCMYYLARQSDIQEKCYKEVSGILGDENMDARVVDELKYLRNVLDETLRCSTLAPYAARYSTEETQLGGYNIPAQTPVIQALGVSLQDENIWPEPDKFDPDRFEKTPGQYAFVPFGFAGKRKCPGYRLTYMEGLVFLTTFLRKFKVKLAAGQSENVGKVHGLVTRPSEDVFLLLERRY